MRWMWLVSLVVMVAAAAGCEPSPVAPPRPPVVDVWEQIGLELAPLAGEAASIASEISDRLQPFSIKRDIEASASALSQAMRAASKKDAQKLRGWLLEAKERLGAAIEELSKQDRRWFNLEELFSRALELLGRIDGLLQRV